MPENAVMMTIRVMAAAAERGILNFLLLILISKSTNGLPKMARNTAMNI